jgi:hypothetical protein
MEWAGEISFSCFNDAWKTYSTHYNKNNITLEKFLERASNGKYKSVPIRGLLKDPPENLSTDRLLAKSIKEAYPSPSPRGPADAASVKYHMRNGNVSPV